MEPPYNKMEFIAAGGSRKENATQFTPASDLAWKIEVSAIFFPNPSPLVCMKQGAQLRAAEGAGSRVVAVAAAVLSLLGCKGTTAMLSEDDWAGICKPKTQLITKPAFHLNPPNPTSILTCAADRPGSPVGERGPHAPGARHVSTCP